MLFKCAFGQLASHEDTTSFQEHANNKWDQVAFVYSLYFKYAREPLQLDSAGCNLLERYLRIE